METYPDPDDIRKNTADILKALTVDNIPERYGFTEELTSLKNCINEDEYCYMTFCETGYAFLKALLRTRLGLKKTDPAHPLLPLISSSVEALRTQLKENEAPMDRASVLLCRADDTDSGGNCVCTRMVLKFSKA